MMLVDSELGGCVIRLWRYGMLILWSDGCILNLGSGFMASYWLCELKRIWPLGCKDLYIVSKADRYTGGRFYFLLVVNID